MVYSKGKLTREQGEDPDFYISHLGQEGTY